MTYPAVPIAEAIYELQSQPRHRKRLYVFGRVTYEDAFGTMHKTDFCESLTGLGLQNSAAMSWNSTDHNDAD